MIIFLILAFLISCIASAMMIRPKPTPYQVGNDGFFYCHNYAMRRLGWGMAVFGFLAVVVLLGIEWVHHQFGRMMGLIDPHPSEQDADDDSGRGR